MSQFFEIHPQHPQPRLIQQAVKILQQGGLLAVPTDAAYSLVGHIGDAQVIQRIRRLRGVDERHHFTLMCQDLAQIATYARVDNQQFRLLKAATPGAYTFILEGSRELPRRLLNPKRKTIGLRIPEHPVMQAMLAALGEPVLSSTLLLPGEDFPLSDPHEIRERLEHSLDLIIESGECGAELTTVVNLAEGEPLLVREGKGALQRLGLV